MSATSSAMRFQWSAATALVSPRSIAPGCASKRVQSLVLPPSIWWAAVAVPQRKPFGRGAAG